VLLRQGVVAFDGPTRDAIAHYRRLLAEERSPDELAAGLREWGTGEASIRSARLLDLEGDERRQYAAGEPFVVELLVSTAENVEPPVLSLELRDNDGVVLAGLTQSTAELGWSGRAGECTLRFEVDRLPLAEGRFHLRAALVGADGERLLYTFDDAASFFVFPAGGESGSVLLSGRWSLEEIGSSEPIGRR
jgi:hypothetical protein